MFLGFGLVSLKAQDRLKGSYLGHFGIQPGISLGFERAFTTWEKETKKKGPRISEFYSDVHLGYFSRLTYNSNFIVGPEVGLIAGKENKLYSRYFLSLNYMLQSEVLYRTVDLSVSVTHVERENRHYTIPLIGYGIGKRFENGLNWDLRIAGGLKFSSDFLNSGMLFLEFGLGYQLNKSE